MWSKVSFPSLMKVLHFFPWGQHGKKSSRAGTAWLGVFCWFMKDKQLLHLICFPTTEIHRMNCALELSHTTALWLCVSQIAPHVGSLLLGEGKANPAACTLVGLLKGLSPYLIIFCHKTSRNLIFLRWLIFHLINEIWDAAFSDKGYVYCAKACSEKHPKKPLNVKF